MIRVIILATLILLTGGPVEASDKKGIYTTFGNVSCSEVLASHAHLNIENGAAKGNSAVHYFVAFVSGYMTAINISHEREKNVFSGMTRIDAANWVASWCRSNPNSGLAKALENLAESRSK
jgi:hypothetical protein